MGDGRVCADEMQFLTTIMYKPKGEEAEAA